MILFDYDDEEDNATIKPEPIFPRVTDNNVQKSAPDYSWGDYLEAAIWRTNIAARFVGPQMLSETHEGEDGPFDLKSLDNTKYAEFAPSFLNAASIYEADKIKQRIDKDLHAREVLAAAPPLVGLSVDWAAGILDPVQDSTYIASAMIGRAVIGAAVAALPFTLPAAVSIGATVATVGAISQAAYHVLLNKSLEETSYIDEQELTFKDTMHAGLMGGAISGISHVSYKALQKGWNGAIDYFYDFLRNSQTKSKTADEMARHFSTRALDGVVGNNVATDLTHRFVLKTLGRFSPANRIAVKASTEVQQTLQDLIVTNFQQEENWHGRPTPVAAETVIARTTDFYNKVTDNIYTATFKDSGYKDRDAFDVEMYKAYVEGGAHSDPIIAKGAQQLIRSVGHEIQEALQKAGVLERNIELGNAEEYIAVLYDPVKIKNNRQAFSKAIENYFISEDKKARAQLPVLEQRMVLIEQTKKEQLGDKAARDELRQEKVRLEYANAIAPSTFLAGEIKRVNAAIKDTRGLHHGYLQGLKASKEALFAQHITNFAPELEKLKKQLADDLTAIRHKYNVEFKDIRRQKQLIKDTHKARPVAEYQDELDNLDNKIRTRRDDMRDELKSKQRGLRFEKGHLMQQHMKDLPHDVQVAIANIEQKKLGATGNKDLLRTLRAEKAKLTPLYNKERDVKEKAKLKAEIDDLKQRIYDAAGTHGQHRMTLTEERRRAVAEKKEVEPRLIGEDNIKHVANLLSSSLATKGEHIQKIEITLPMPGRKPGTYEKDRRVTIPQSLMTDFLETNMIKVMQRYIRKSVADIVLASKFGRHDTLSGTETHKRLLKEMDDLIRQYPEHIDEIKANYASNIEDLEAIFQRTRYQPAPSAWNWNIDWRIQMGLKAARSYAATCLLGQSAFSLIPDLASAVSVRGFTALVGRTIPNLTWRRSAAKLARSELRALDAGCRNTLNGSLARDFSDLIGDVPKQYGKLAKVNKVLNMANYAQQVANGSIMLDRARARLIEMTVQQDTLWLCGRVARGKANRKDISRLASIGLTEFDAVEINKMQMMHVPKRSDRSAGVAGVDNWGDRDLAHKYGNALQTYIMKHDVSTSHVDQPLIYDNPFINCIMQFSAWAFTLVNKILAQGTQLGWGLLGPTIISGIALGIFANEIKYQYKTKTGVWKEKERSVADIVLAGVEATGYTGIIGQMGGKAWRSIEYPGGALREHGGPVLGVVSDFYQFAHGLKEKVLEGEPLDRRTITAGNNLIPFSKYFVVDAVLAEMEGIRYVDSED